MAQALPRAEVVRRFIDESFDPHAPVWVLRWPAGRGTAERLWELPRGLALVGGPPAQLGVVIHRDGPDRYAVRLCWEQTQLSWPAVSRLELLGSCLAPVLKAVGLDLWSLLQQPVAGPRPRQWAA
jgi:hypothetical protein